MKKFIENFTSLRLHGMQKSWLSMKETKKLAQLSFIDGVELLLQAEKEEREHRKSIRLIQQAGFRYKASIEQLNYESQRGLDRNLMTQLCSTDYLQNGESILISGATGCGKSFIASALGDQACSHGFKVAYFNIQKLMLKTKLMRVEGTLHKYFNKLAKVDLLIIDDFGLINLDKNQQVDFMEIIEDRHAKKSTIIASQLPVESWYDVFNEETIADAVLDRLVHTSYKINLRGESLRKKK